jgi:hypothetical protein
LKTTHDCCSGLELLDSDGAKGYLVAVVLHGNGLGGGLAIKQSLELGLCSRGAGSSCPAQACQGEKTNQEDFRHFVGFLDRAKILCASKGRTLITSPAMLKNGLFLALLGW